MFEKGDEVVFDQDGEERTGCIFVVDVRGGGSFDGICTSYDIFVRGSDGDTLFKHVPFYSIRGADPYDHWLTDDRAEFEEVYRVMH